MCFSGPSIREFVPLRSAESLKIPGEPQVLSVPGHTRGSVAFWLPDRRVLLAGDALVTLDMWAIGPLSRDSFVESYDIDVRKEQIFEVGILQVLHHRPVLRNFPSCLAVGFQVARDSFSRSFLGSLDAAPVGCDGEVGGLDGESGFRRLKHDQESHHLISSWIFFTVSTDRPTGTSFCGWMMVTTNRLLECLKLW